MKSSFLKPPEFLSLPFFGVSLSKTSIRLTKFKSKKIGLVPQIIDEVPVKEVCEFFTDPNAYAECNELKKSLKDLKKKLTLLNPSSNPSDRFVYDPSNNVLLFETILRSNNNNPS